MVGNRDIGKRRITLDTYLHKVWKFFICAEGLDEIVTNEVTEDALRFVINVEGTCNGSEKG